MGMPQIYCSLCGAPISAAASKRDQERDWLCDAILLTSAHQTNEGFRPDEYWPPPPGKFSFTLGPDAPGNDQRCVLRHEGYTNGAQHFQLAETGEEVIAFRVADESDDPEEDHGGTMYLPVHRACLGVADHFIAKASVSADTAQANSCRGISSIIQLWEVLSRRLCGIAGGDYPCWKLAEPHHYFGGDACRNVYWEADDDPQFAELATQHPMEIHNLTHSILQNLEISADLESSERQDEFYQALTDGEAIPWLWDIDPDVICEKFRVGSWKWEFLINQLQQPELENSALQLPLALLNRRRIWRLLEEARIGDVAEIEESEMRRLG